MNDKTKTKVAIYCRISKDPTKSFSQDVDRQIHEAREYCNRMDYEIVEEYSDEGFARTPQLLLNLLDELKLWNVNLVSVKKNIDTSSVMGELVAIQ